MNDTERMNLTRRESYVTLALSARENLFLVKKEKRKRKRSFSRFLPSSNPIRPTTAAPPAATLGLLSELKTSFLFDPPSADPAEHWRWECAVISKDR